MERSGFIGSTLAASALLLGLLPCFAGDSSDWANLSQIKPGEHVLVVRYRMKTVKGGFESFSADSIVIRQESAAAVIPKNEVVRVTILERGHRLRNTVIGTAAGGALGVLIGHLATTRWNGGREGVLAASAIAGMGGGAALGATTAGHPTVYRTATTVHAGK